MRKNSTSHSTIDHWSES
jgi:hypothetical protein